MTTHLAGHTRAQQQADADRGVDTSLSGGVVEPPDPSEARRTYPHRTDHGVDESRAPHPGSAGADTARRTLLSAITARLRDKHFSAAQAALVLHLTGPQATDLLDGYVDNFSLEELINLLPLLELTIEVVPEPQP
jgi:predicted XRE-type DNA-binding protein